MTTPPSASDAREVIRRLEEWLKAGPGDMFPENATDLLREARALLAQQERRGAEMHDIISRLWSAVDPDDAPDLMPLVHGVLGADAIDGDCGNRICGELREAETQLSALQSRLEAAEARIAAWESVFGHLSTDPDEAGNLINKARSTLDAALARLEPYVQHRPECDVRRGQPCNCGFPEDTLRALQSGWSQETA